MEKMHWQHLGDIRANKPSATELPDQLNVLIQGEGGVQRVFQFQLALLLR